MPSPRARLQTSVAPHLGPIVDDDRADRDRLGGHELAIVLSYYDLGVIRRIQTYLRGSRRSPKLHISAERGEFMLKRRAPGRDDPRRVTFAHELQQLLAARGYPVPGLIGTRDRDNSMLRLSDMTYEMFRFIEGERDDRSPGAAELSGQALGRLHRLLRQFESAFVTPTGSYHASATIENAMRQIPSMVKAAGSSVNVQGFQTRCEFLYQAYVDAAKRAKEAGIADSMRGVIHGDWHPGNLLFRDGAVAAVLDFDSARMEGRIIDVANAALQFSMKMGPPDDLAKWSKRLDVERIKALLTGYDASAVEPLTQTERAALPWLIVEALILESVLPIAATGRFGQLDGAEFLEIIERKVRWLRPRSKRLLEYLAED